MCSQIDAARGPPLYRKEIGRVFASSPSFMYATKNIRAWTWLLSSRIGIVPTVAVYLISRPSMCTTCDVDETFSSLGPKYSSRAVGADVVALGGVCAGGAPPRPCA